MSASAPFLDELPPTEDIASQKIELLAERGQSCSFGTTARQIDNDACFFLAVIIGLQHQRSNPSKSSGIGASVRGLSSYPREVSVSVEAEKSVDVARA